MACVWRISHCDRGRGGRPGRFGWSPPDRWDIDFSGTEDYVTLSPTLATNKVLSVDQSLAQNGVVLHLWGNATIVTAKRWRLQ